MDKNQSQVFMGLELVSTAMNLAEELKKETSPKTDWKEVADYLKHFWTGQVDFASMVRGEPDLMAFLREQLVYMEEILREGK